MTEVHTWNSLQNTVDQSNNLYKSKYPANLFLKISPATDALSSLWDYLLVN